MIIHRLTILSLFFLTGSAVSPLFAQTDPGPGHIRSLPAPDTDQICTLGHSDVDAHYFIRPEPHVRQRMLLQQEADFQVTFENSCNGSTWPNQAQAAVEYALSIWSVHVQSSIPIRVETIWDNDIESLGSAGPTRIIHSSSIPGAETDTWYSIAQASAMSGIDFVTVINTRPDAEESYDIRVRINCEVNNWYFATDGNPGSGQLDLVTAVLHEIGHGLGFIGTMSANNNNQTAEWGIPPGNEQDNLHPIIYDRFVNDGDDIMVLNESVYPNDSNELYQAVTGNRSGLFFTGENTNRSLAGMPARLHAPNPWQSGSSYSHVHHDEYSGTVNALMRPSIQTAFAIHSPGPAFCGILADKGWPLGINCMEIFERDAIIAVEPDTIDFHLVNIDNSQNRDLIVRNDVLSEDPVQGWIEIEGNEFSIGQGSTDTFNLDPGQEQVISLRFEPVTTGIKTGRLLLFHNAINESSPIEIVLTGEALESEILAKMDQNFPNPFNLSTQINYGLPAESDVRIDLYTVTGRHVRTLVNERQSAGPHDVVLDAGGLSSGMYFYRIIVDRYSDTKKMLLVR